MSSAPATPVSAVSSSTLANPGRVGQAPSAPRAVYFPEAGGYRNFARILFAVAGFFVLLGIVTMITIGGPAWLFLLPAPGFVLWGWNRQRSQPHMDCVCDDSGMMVRMSKGSTPLPPIFISWAAVNQTVCRTITTTSRDWESDVETKNEYLAFRVISQGQSVEIEATRVKNVAGLIALANQSTPQLEYVWLPAKQAKDRQVLTKAGKYWKVAR